MRNDSPQRAMEQWVGLMRAWVDMWAGFLPGSSAGPWQNPWLQPFQPATTTAVPAQNVAVKVRVSSPVAAEVNANLITGDWQELTIDAPGLSGLSIGREAGGVVVALQVDAGQHPGQYRGTIKCGTRIVGDVTVRILARPAGL